MTASWTRSSSVSSDILPGCGGHWTVRWQSKERIRKYLTQTGGHHWQEPFQDGIATRTTAAIPTQEAATSEKGIELSEEEATFDDGNTETVSRPTQVPEEKLDETFTSIPPSELEYGEDKPEDEEPDKKQASGSSFEDIDMAVHTIWKESPSDEEMRHAGKVMTELDGTELFTR